MGNIEKYSFVHEGTKTFPACFESLPKHSYSHGLSRKRWADCKLPHSFHGVKIHYMCFLLLLMMLSQLFLMLVKKVHSYVVVWTGGRRSAEGTALPGVWCFHFLTFTWYLHTSEEHWCFSTVRSVHQTKVLHYSKSPAGGINLFKMLRLYDQLNYVNIWQLCLL